MQEVLSEKINIKLKFEEQREKLEMLVLENANLKEKINDQENDIKKIKK